MKKAIVGTTLFVLAAISFAAYNSAIAYVEGVMNPAAPAHTLFYAHLPSTNPYYPNGTTITEYTSGSASVTTVVHGAGTWHLFISWVDEAGVHAQYGDIAGVQVYAGNPAPHYQVDMVECSPVQTGTPCSVYGDSHGL